MTMDNDVYDEENVLLSPTPFCIFLQYSSAPAIFSPHCTNLKPFKPVAVQVVYNTTAIWELIYER